MDPETEPRGRHEGGPLARERALSMLTDMIAQGGAAAFLMPPVEPGEAAFPDPWAPSKAGVELLLRRLVWHAGMEDEVEVAIDDRRAGAPPTERKPATRVDLVEVRGKRALFALGFVGSDDGPGTLALEVGTLWAVLHRPDKADPYRTATARPVVMVESEADHVRGAVAAVYRGLGVLAANAAYQQYTSPGRFNGIYVPHEYDVVTAGVVPVSTLAYLVAVQAVVRGESEVPPGLGQSQRDECAGFMKLLAGERGALCERLGLARDADGPPSREAPVAFADASDVTEEAPSKNAFRWQTNRGGVGFIAGTVLGMGVAMAVSRGMLPIGMFGGATAGHLVGRRVKTPRCSACATVVAPAAGRCPSCGAALRGDIASLADRLEAEERLERGDVTDVTDVAGDGALPK